jgi:hypothetical protein
MVVLETIAFVCWIATVSVVACVVSSCATERCLQKLARDSDTWYYEEKAKDAATLAAQNADIVWSCTTGDREKLSANLFHGLYTPVEVLNEGMKQAARKGHTECCLLLINHGASAHVGIEAARSAGWSETVRKLEWSKEWWKAHEAVKHEAEIEAAKQAATTRALLNE